MYVYNLFLLNEAFLLLCITHEPRVVWYAFTDDWWATPLQHNSAEEDKYYICYYKSIT